MNGISKMFYTYLFKVIWLLSSLGAFLEILQSSCRVVVYGIRVDRLFNPQAKTTTCMMTVSYIIVVYFLLHKSNLMFVELSLRSGVNNIVLQ